MRKRKRNRFPLEAGLYNLNKYKQKNSQEGSKKPSFLEKIMNLLKLKSTNN